MKTIQTSRLLKTALAIDAVASGTLGALQLFAPRFLSDALSLPTALISGTGVFLIAYTVLLVALASMRNTWQLAVQVIVFGNIGWAMACLALAAGSVLAPNGLGEGYLALQAVAVLLFAWLEFAGLKASALLQTDGKLQFQ